MNAAASGVGAGSASRPTVTVLDYGAGNVRSVVRALEEVGADVVLSSREADVLEADGLVVPGVGAFDAVMRGLRSVQAPRMIGRRIAGGRPVLGICVGLQILFEEGIEHGIRSEGLGEWPGTVRKLPGEVVPHMGWNTVEPPGDTVLFRGIENERFYFVHSYAVQDWTFVQGNNRMRPPGVAWSEHGARFVAAVENGPLSATQFHPEKSSAAGLRLLENWTDSLPRTGRMASRGADKQAQTMPDPQKDVR